MPAHLPLSGLAPRRRAFLLAVAALAVLGLGALLVAGRSGSGAAPRPFAAQDRPGPVLLVPGYGGSLDSLAVLVARRRAAGRDARAVPMPAQATGDLREQARALDRAVRAAEAAGAASVDVVGYSNGGVVARLWVREHDGAHRARRVVTLGSPQHGTDLAAAAQTFGGGLCEAACQQVAPGSEVLSELNRGDETPDGPQWLAVWTTRDATVRPPDSARLAGAVSEPVQAVCPDDRAAHGDLPRDPAVVGLVVRALGTAPIVPAGPGDCAAVRTLGAGRGG